MFAVAGNLQKPAFLIFLTSCGNEIIARSSLLKILTMRYTTLLFILICTRAFAQPTATISSNSTFMCQNSAGTQITFTGSNGIAPYTFFYNINGGATQSVTTTTGNSVVITPNTGTAGSFTYNLTAVEDATPTNQGVSGSVTLTVNALPNVNGGPNQVICQGGIMNPTPSGAMTYSYVPPTMNPTSNGTYTVYGVDLNGCMGSGTFSVTVNPLPVVNAGTDQQICPGQVAPLNATGANTYSWTPATTLSAANIDNPIASPAITTTYTVTGTSTLGCTNTDQITVNVLPTPTVSAGPDLTICEGTAFVPTGSGNPGLTYFWDNGLVNGQPSYPPPGTMVLTVSGYDAQGCMGTDQMILTVLNQPADPGAVIDSAYCNNGMITIIQGPQTTGYTFNWMNGSTSGFIDNLAAGPYVCYMTDANGCTAQYTYVVPSTVLPLNCAQITGTAYFDNDQNCTIGTGDDAAPNRMILVTPGNYLAVTDQNGFYSFNLPVGNYTVTEIFNDPTIGNYCNQTYSVSIVNLTDVSSNNDFLDTINGAVDLQAGIYNSTIVPGFPFTAQVAFYSQNTVGTLMNAQAWFTLPSGVTMQTWSYPHTVSNDTVYFNLNTVQSFNSAVPFQAPANLALGTLITFCAGITPAPSEIVLNNNNVCYTSEVVGSYDPNDKTMFLNGVKSDSTIYLTDQVLDYVIRFQNTGTAPAQNIYILDTIQSTLELSSFQFVCASHNCNVSILEGNVLKFNFPLIMLPDSTNNEPQSHGYVHYRIRQSNQNAIGNVINNTAYIYFDFNAPVVTNTTYDMIVVDDLGIDETTPFSVKLYPNPATSILNIQSDITIERIELRDMNGRIIDSRQSESKHSVLDLSGLTKGVYLITLHKEGSSVVKRIVIQ